MKKILIICLFSIFAYAGDAIVDNDDCIESLENEIIGVIYKNKIKNSPTDVITNEINKTFSAKCDTPPKKKVVVIKKSADIKDCIEDLENEILTLVKNSKNNEEEVSVQILIENVSKNFEDCKVEK